MELEGNTHFSKDVVKIIRFTFAGRKSTVFIIFPKSL